MEVRIEVARPEDLAGILGLLEAAGLPTAGLADHLTTALVARAGGQPVGTAALEIYGEVALLRSVAVRADWGGRGLGTALVEAALDLGRRQGVKSFYLLTETAPGFFARLGFRVIPRSAVPEALRASAEFRGACPETATAMVLAERDPREIKLAVAEAYGQVARSAEGGMGCCRPAGSCCEPAGNLVGVPADAVASYRGCGDPVGRAGLRPGEVVLDLGAGGGLDVILAARQVGPAGAVYGLDLSAGMTRLARRNLRGAGLENVGLILGDLEAIPLRPGSVDVIISNCVINLTPGKVRALFEACRVLKPGGRLVVSDIVVDPDLNGLPVKEREIRSALSWTGCLAGALTTGQYRAFLEAAGFRAINIRIDYRYSPAGLGPEVPDPLRRLAPAVLADLAGRFAGATITACKPG